MFLSVFYYYTNVINKNDYSSTFKFEAVGSFSSFISMTSVQNIGSRIREDIQRNSFKEAGNDVLINIVSAVTRYSLQTKL